MARKTRKSVCSVDNEAINNLLPGITKAEIFSTAIYVRISVETLEKRERGSMENQVEFLKDFVASNEELRLLKTYIDDDTTGTNFDRPAFKKLIEDIKKGQINCIVVKDLSRFGRNYIETGEYIEKIFPFFKIRFIAINDRFDSFNDHQGIVTPFKNIVNEIYAKDISRKICSSVQTRQNKGEYIGGMAAYGYLKDSRDKHKLIIDSETAPIVRQIFDLKIKGLSYMNIARKLNRLGIMSPAQYKYSIGILHKEENKTHLWNDLNVKRILHNPIYMGNMVQGKYRQSFYNNKERTQIDENQWIVIPNTHEAIIDKATFENVKHQLEDINASINKKGYKNNENQTKNIFKGLIYCGQCGRAMFLHTSSRNSTASNKKVSATYKCITYRQNLNQNCADKRIKFKVLIKTVKTLLVEYSKVLFDINESVNKSSSVKKSKLHSDDEIKKRISEKRTEKIRMLDVKLYTDYAEGLLTKEEYVTMKGNYNAELAFLQKEIKSLELQIQIENKINSEYIKATNVMKEFLEKNELNEDILQQLVERIEIYHTDTVAIRFKFEDYVEKRKIDFF